MTVCALAHLLLLMGEIEYGARGSSFLGDDWYWGRGREGKVTVILLLRWEGWSKTWEKRRTFKTLDLDGEIMVRGLPRDTE